MKVISLLFVLSACATPKKFSDPVREIFMGRLEKYRQCYHESEQYKGKDVTELGKMKIGIAVNDGLVKNAKILETDFKKDASFDACILGQVKALKFSEGQNFETTQLLSFEPGQL